MQKPSPEAMDAAGRRFLDDALSGHPELRRQVLALVHDIRIRDDIPTARVRVQGGRFLLEISPQFVAATLPTPADRRFVLMHEVRHLERGDLLRTGRFYRRFPRMVNLAMDIYVNGSVLGSGYFQGRAASGAPAGLNVSGAPGVLERCYDPRRRPQCMLLPPWSLLAAWSDEDPGAADHQEIARYLVSHRLSRWGDDRRGDGSRGDGSRGDDRLGEGHGDGQVQALPRGRLQQLATITASVLARVGFRQAPEAARLYLGGWSRTMPFNDFLERLHRLLASEGILQAVEGRPLLFEHDLEALDRELRRRPARPGKGGELRQRTVSPVQDILGQPEGQAFFQSLRAALDTDPAHPSLRRDAPVLLPSVLLHLGRREAALIAAGVCPVLSNAPGSALGLSTERVHLYLDVSGSMDQALAFLVGLTLTARDLIGPELYQFSNRVVPVTPEQLQRGHVATTGGTDLDCVARHARERGFRKILVVTDGMVSLDEASRVIFHQRMETYVVLTGWNPPPPRRVTDTTETYAKRWWNLPLPPSSRAAP